MIDQLYGFLHHAPLIVLVASFLDVFFFTGYIVYGATMVGGVAMLLATDMVTPGMVFIMASVGTIAGNLLNFTIGRYFGESAFIRHRIKDTILQRVQNYVRGKHLIALMLICRFVVVLRPSYALILGTLGVRPHRFVMYEIVIALFWVSIWLLIIIQATEWVTAWW